MLFQAVVNYLYAIFCILGGGVLKCNYKYMYYTDNLGQYTTCIFVCYLYIYKYVYLAPVMQ